MTRCVQDAFFAKTQAPLALPRLFKTCVNFKADIRFYLRDAAVASIPQKRSMNCCSSADNRDTFK